MQHSAPPDSAAGLSSISPKHFGTARRSIPHQVLLYFRWFTPLLTDTMPCCSSCSLPVQGHQIPTGPHCSILFDEAVHSSGMEPECAVCQLPWSGHPRGKHIPKDLSSAVARCKGSQGRTNRNIRRTGTSTPGCRASPWKTRPLRCSCHSSRSWCTSCFPIHPKHLCRQGKLRQLAQHSRLLSPQPHPARQQACPR